MRISDWSSDVCSSDLIATAIAEANLPVLAVGLVERAAYRDIFDFSKTLSELESDTTSGLENARGNAAKLARSEEHTSELQSLMRISYAVFCLKKKSTATRRTRKQPPNTRTLP